MTGDGIFSADAITRGLQTRTLGQRIVFYERIGSTNDAAEQLADAGEPEGTVVIADEQTAGRGRLGRAWIAPPRSSILMSIILRPKLAPYQASRVMMAVALGACEAVRAETGLDVRIKWPNDLLVRGKKFAGILSESGIVGEKLEYVIVGIGINVNFNVVSSVISREQSDREISHSTNETPALAFGASVSRGVYTERSERARNDMLTVAGATTIADELGKPFSRARLVQSLLRSIENFYLPMGEDLHAEYCNRLVTLHQSVRVQTLSGVVEGIAESVNENGALLVRRADGSLIEFYAGDVTLIKSRGG